MNLRYSLLRVTGDKRFKTSVILVLLLMQIGIVSAVDGDLETLINTFLCSIAHLIFNIAIIFSVIAIVFHGIKWATSADDPAARSAAKSGIFYILIGVFIVVAAMTIVLWTLDIAGVGEPINIEDCILKGEVSAP